MEEKRLVITIGRQYEAEEERSAPDLLRIWASDFMIRIFCA